MRVEAEALQRLDGRTGVQWDGFDVQAVRFARDVGGDGEDQVERGIVSVVAGRSDAADGLRAEPSGVSLQAS